MAKIKILQNNDPLQPGVEYQTVIVVKTRMTGKRLTDHAQMAINDFLYRVHQTLQPMYVVKVDKWNIVKGNDEEHYSIVVRWHIEANVAPTRSAGPALVLSIVISALIAALGAAAFVIISVITYQVVTHASTATDAVLIGGIAILAAKFAPRKAQLPIMLLGLAASAIIWLRRNKGGVKT